MSLMFPASMSLFERQELTQQSYINLHPTALITIAVISWLFIRTNRPVFSSRRLRPPLTPWLQFWHSLFLMKRGCPSLASCQTPLCSYCNVNCLLPRLVPFLPHVATAFMAILPCSSRRQLSRTQRHCLYHSCSSQPIDPTRGHVRRHFRCPSHLRKRV